MFYQPIILNREAYNVRCGGLRDYPLHWHSDLEIIYCIRGSFSVRIEEEKYTLTSGQIMIAGSAIPHEIYDCREDNRITLIRIGSVFLGSKIFAEIALKQFSPPVIDADEEIRDVIARMGKMCEKEDDLKKELLLRTDLYLLLALLLEKVPSRELLPGEQKKRLRLVMNIQKTLDFVATNYEKNITVEKAAEIVGYEKSAFCRIFKQATDMSFHQYLNLYRINTACTLLAENHLPVARVAESVGFTETKTFCRIFKQLKGMTPTEYRKKEEK